MSKLKHFGAYLLDIAKIILKTLRSKKFWLVLGVALSYYLVYWFSSHYYLKGPDIKWPCFVCERYPSKEKVVKVSEIAQKQDILAKSEAVETENDPLENIYQMTRQFESGKGTAPTPGSTHLYCQSIGEVNEIGYFPEGNRKFCFTDEAEQRLTFFRWVDKQIDKGLTLAEAMCFYVTGVVQPTCKRVLDMGL